MFATFISNVISEKAALSDILVETANLKPLNLHEDKAVTRLVQVQRLKSFRYASNIRGKTGLGSHQPHQSTEQQPKQLTRCSRFLQEPPEGRPAPPRPPRPAPSQAGRQRPPLAPNGPGVTSEPRDGAARGGKSGSPAGETPSSPPLPAPGLARGAAVGRP